MPVIPALLKRFVSASRGRLFSPTPRASDQEHSSPPSPLPFFSIRSRRPRLGDFRSSTTVYNIFPASFSGLLKVYYKQIERCKTLCPPCASAPDFFKISHISLNLSKLKDFFNLLADNPLRTHHISIDVPTSRVISATMSYAVNVLLESGGPFRKRNDRLS